jgi:hypothetical protein
VSSKNDDGALTSTIRVEIVLDPVHFCSAADARAKTLNFMANLLRNAGWHELCWI